MRRLTVLASVLACVLGSGRLSPARSDSAPALGGVGPSTKAAPAAENLVGVLETFCVKWMGLLATRERDNRTAVRWQTRPEGVSGEYVGYSTDYQCQLRQAGASGGTPVGTITYRELLYQQSGASVADAAQSAARVKEATEVTEIFRYSKGQWVY